MMVKIAIITLLAIGVLVQGRVLLGLVWYDILFLKVWRKLRKVNQLRWSLW